MQCPRCKRENPPQAKFCLECALPLKVAGPIPGSSIDLKDEIESLRRALSEALEQQSATSEILRVISSSPTDLQPVLDAIATNAARVCGAYDATVLLREGDLVRRVAHYGPIPHFIPDVRPISSEIVSNRAILDHQPVHVHDILATEREDLSGSQESAPHSGYRTILAVPLLREGEAVGALAIRRREVQPFTDGQIMLLETFADQAVIAIENVRLFTELQEKNRALTQAHAQMAESLEQQTATSEILRVISASPTDVQPVFDIIAEAAMRLCGAVSSLVTTFDRELLHLCAQADINPEGTDVLRQIYPRPLGRGFAAGRAMLTRDIVHIPDIHADSQYEHSDLGRAAGFRGILAVPMLRHGVPIGTINVHKALPGPFPDTQIELLQTFAEQAVIAIENVRLFKELQARTAELTRSVEQLTALGEVGRAVSSTLDLETVLTTIVSRAVQLSGPVAGAIYEYDEEGEEFQLRATENFEAEYVELLRAMPIRKGEGALGRVAVTRQPVQIPDFTKESTYQSRFREALTRLGYHALLAVPLLREDRIIGGLVINGKTPGEFPPEIIELLKTLATQSALAIQNARLFREIADKSQQLEAASRHKSEFLANMSHELRTPLNAIIGFSEVLLERMFGEVNDKQTEYLQDILSSGQHLLSLINDILDLSKIEAGRMELALAAFRLPQALEDALTLVKERAARHGIALKLDIDPRLGEFAGDERKIKQVLLNLLSNAVKFTPEGGRITVKAALSDGSVEISVSDTGIGIAPEDQGAIFEEFRQVGGDDARKQEGTGLGLTLTKKFVEMHGGRIWVQSEVGRGSTFRFTLPMS